VDGSHCRSGKAILKTFENHADAEQFAECQRLRLGLPANRPLLMIGSMPIEESAVDDPTEMTGQARDSIVSDVLDSAKYTDHGVIVTLIGAQGDRIDLHVTIGMGEFLCERIAVALECLYGKSS
jgi:hypothetical protein